MLTAITRGVSARLPECELTFQKRERLDIVQAEKQHFRYEKVLAQLGVNVVHLPAQNDQPDCVFVEDPVIVLDEIAILTRMGAESRRGESQSLGDAVAQFREVHPLEEPAILEGGDVMRIDKTLYVGLSQRTNFVGIQQLARLVEPYGYWVTPVEVRGCLHLKSACSHLGNGMVIVNRQWIDADAFCGLRFLDVPTSEPNAANVLRVRETIVMPSSYPRTEGVLEENGFQVRTVDVSEFLKAEAGVTCMSLLFESD